MKEICRVEIPQYIRQVELSKSQRPVYFEWNGITIKGRGMKIPLKYYKNKVRTFPTLIEHLTDDVVLGIFKKNKFSGIVDTNDIKKLTNLLPNTYKFRLCNKIDNSPIICNHKKVGTPRIYLIKGQDIYSGNLREFTKGFIMDKIKECYKPYIENLPVINDYPIKIVCEVYDTINNPYDKGNRAWDLDNYVFLYFKAFPDLLQSLGKIRNDDRLHITQPPSAIFCPIERHEDRKLVFIIYKDDRDIIVNNKIYKEFFNSKVDLSLLNNEIPFT